MSFAEYLIGKKIDPKKFQENEHKLFMDFQKLFDQVHPNSFTQQKLFLLNKIRRKYPVVEEATGPPEKVAAKPVRPKMKPLKPKTN